MVLRYVEIDSNEIINLCGPERIPEGWDEKNIRRRKENAQELIERRNKKDGFYDNLEADILKNGIRNPILVTAGLFSEEYLESDLSKTFDPRRLIKRIPPELRDNARNLLTCEYRGGSRLWVAQKNGLIIPCIVHDFVERFPDAKAIKTKRQLAKYFKDEPMELELKDSTITKISAEAKTNEFVTKYAVIPSKMINNVQRPSDRHQAQLEEQNQFFSKLEKSILKEGFRNPLVITAKKDSITPRYGGSRLMIAQKHDLDVPCIIADFDNIFPDAKAIKFSQIKDYYVDKPKHLSRVNQGINMSGCEHVHLDQEFDDDS